ncbi:MAG: hypothetical protein LBT86_05065 [Deltaproteobacteria bacterium]|jgi:hypothetical protein|nr:hypothetical protein [Deltaproteobacteria bacterium]
MPFTRQTDNPAYQVVNNHSDLALSDVDHINGIQIADIGINNQSVN